MLTRPLTIADAVHRAVAAGRERLLDAQHPDGRWEGIVHCDPGITAQYLLTARYVDRLDPANDARLLAHLDQSALPTGGWAAYPGGPPSLDVSLLCYVALRFAGRSPDSRPMQEARGVILASGGIEASGFVPRFPLVFWGQIPPSGLTYLSPKLLFMPRWIHPNFHDLGILLQAVLPVELLLKWRAVKTPPEGCGLEELHSGRPHTPVIMTPLGGAISRASNAVDTILPMRRLDRRAADWLAAQQNRDGTWAGVAVFTTRSAMALHAVDPIRYRRHIDHALAGMRRLQIVNGETSWQQSGRSPVVDTAIAAASLLDAGLPPTEARLAQAVRWLLSVQTDSGGWSHKEDNERTPDADTTLHVLEVLARAPHAAPRTPDALAQGTHWLLAKQDASGGWAMWPTNWRSGRMIVLEIDRAGVLDVSTPDVTARTVRALAQLRDHVTAQTRRRIDAAMARAVVYLQQTQRPDGTWPGRWAVNFAYGTAQGLTALMAAGHGGSAAAAWARRALVEMQQPDGGWGESPSSDKAGRYVSAPSTVTQTALALLGLLNVPTVPDEVVSRGSAFLLERARGGAWDDETFCQTILPGHMHFQNSLLATSLAVMTLARAERQGAGRAQT